MSVLNFIEKVCVQTAVYWGNPQPDGYGGMTYKTPEDIKVRWDDTIRQISDGKGDQIVCRAVIMTPETLQEKGMLYLGKLDDLTEEEKGNPHNVNGAYSIKRVDKTPLFRSTDKFVITVYL